MSCNLPAVAESPDRFWTPERVELAKKLWTEGLSAAQIAWHIGAGCTRSAVLGKLHRLKFTQTGERRRGNVQHNRLREPRPPAVRRAAVQPARIKDARAKRAESAAPPPEPEVDVPTRADAWLPLPGTTPVPLLELRRDQCKWPIGEVHAPGFGFCGAPMAKGDERYCPAHHQLSKGAAFG